jgi:biotin carboxylase
LLKNKIRTPITVEFSLKSPTKEIISRVSKLIKTYPIVLKPFEGYGSVGVQIINDKNEFEKSLKEYAVFQKTHPTMAAKFLAQEYIDGEEGFLDFYSINGKHLFTDAWMYHKLRIANSTFHNDGYLIMKKTPQLVKAETYCKKVLDAIGFK